MLKKIVRHKPVLLIEYCFVDNDTKSLIKDKINYHKSIKILPDIFSYPVKLSNLNLYL